MKLLTSLAIAYAIGVTNASPHGMETTASPRGMQTTTSPRAIQTTHSAYNMQASRPRLAHMIAHLERNHKLTWKDHELGGGAKVAVYRMQDWIDTKDYLNTFGTDHLFNLGEQNDTQPAIDQPTLAPRVPIAAPSELPAGASVIPGSVIAPFEFKQVATPTSTTSAATGTGTMPASDGKNHVTKWVCQQPYNIPVNLGQGALASIICTYIFPFLQSAVTAPGRDTIVETIALPPAPNPASPGRFAQVLVHLEKNQLWPALKAVLCSTLITQVVNNLYCWGYGTVFGTQRRIKRQQPSILPDSTVGGTVFIYDDLGTSVAGLVEIDVYGP